MSVKELGDNFFGNENVKRMVSETPYFSFILLGAVLEFIAKTRKQKTTSHKARNSHQICCEAINNIAALDAYKDFNYEKNGKTKNYLYSLMRCGMLHSLLPKDQIVLAPKDNKIELNIVGAENLFNDLHDAWEELKQDSSIIEYMTNTEALQVNDNLSGSTLSNVSSISTHE